MIRATGVALVLLFLTTFAVAQETGRIAGVVQDPSGAVIPGAVVTATEAGTGFERTSISNATGSYIFPSLRPTQYTISTEAPGFSRYAQSGIELLANASVTLNITLQVGDVTETVEVAADAVQVNTTNATIGEVVEQRRIVELPLEGRNAASLTTLVPGAILATSQGGSSEGVDQGVTKTQRGAVVVSTNGSQLGSVAFKLDGVNNTDFYTNANMRFPAPDFLQEYSVQTSNYTAEQGANSGAVVNLVTRSGTNEFHGGGFWFVRNREFNARNTFANDVDPLQRNQFGGFLGGPIVRNKTFFFYGFQQTEIRSQRLSENAFVPTNDQLNGNFATCGDNCSDPIRDFTTGNVFPNNQIPVARFDPASVALTKFLPRAGGSGFVTFPGGKENQDIADHTVRVDHQFTPLDRLMGRYFLAHFGNDALTQPDNLLVYRDQSRIRSQSAGLTYSRSFSATFLNEFRLSYNRTHASRNPPDGVPNVIDLGVNLNLNPTPKAMQGINVSGFFDFGDNPTASFKRNGYELSNGASWIAGNHTIKFGGSIQHQRVDLDNLYRQPATFGFSGDATGLATADFMLGAMSSFDQGMGEFKDNRRWIYHLYVQDDIRVSSRLSLNLGVRWEPLKPWFEARGRLEKFDIDAYQQGITSTVFLNAPAGESFRGDPGFPYDGGTKADYFNVAPRVGFAYDLTGDGRTSLRGGVGAFFDQQIDDQNNGAVNASPFSTRISFSGSPIEGPFSDPYRGYETGDPFPSPPPSADSPFPRPVLLATYTPQIISPLTWNWNVSIERQFASDWMARVAYVGSRRTHGLRGQQLNSSWYDPNNVDSAGRPLLGDDARRLFAPEFGSISTFSWDQNSHYHSMQSSLNKRFSGGFTLQMNYTWSKSLDNAGSVIPTTYFEPRPEYLFGDRMNWGPAATDRRHRVVVSYVWDLPTVDSNSFFARALVNGWQATGIFQSQTGPPLTIESGRDNSFTDIGNDRAVLTGESVERPESADKQRMFFNTGAFGINPIGTFGTVGRGTITGPSLTSWNVGLFKRWSISERTSVQFRAEFFNMLNNVNLYTPQTNVASGSFGRITSAEDPRIMQFGLKLLF